MSQFDRAHTTSYLTLRYKAPILTHPTCIWRPRTGWPRSNFAEIFGVRKLESLGYHCGVVCMILCLAILVEHRLVTVRRADRQTDTGHSIYCTSIASRGKNIVLD